MFLSEEYEFAWIKDFTMVFNSSEFSHAGYYQLELVIQDDN